MRASVTACVPVKADRMYLFLTMGVAAPQDAIERVRELEAKGRLTGVMDDRGKYIYISRAEMAAVADFITRRGRVAIAELAAQVQRHSSCHPQASSLRLILSEKVQHQYGHLSYVEAHL